MLLSDEEAREVVLLLSQTEEKHNTTEIVANEKTEILNSTVTHDVFDTTIIHDGTEYHFLKDGHYYFEYPGLSPAESEEITESSAPKDITFDSVSPPKKKSKIYFSTDPIRVNFILFINFFLNF